MPPTHVNREEVERRKNRLLDEYGDAPVEEETREVPADLFSDLLAYSRAGYIGGGYAWVVRGPDDAPELSDSMGDVTLPDADRVLMILSRGSEDWGLPGGGQEDDEGFDETAVREVREETGVECEPKGLFLLRHVVTTSAGDQDERLHVLRVFFDAQYVGGHVRIQPGELNGAAWFAEPPARMQPENEYRAETFF